MKKYLTGLIAGAALTGGLALASGGTASAEPTDGTITVRVVEDRNLDNARGVDDLPLSGWDVRFTDVDGDTVTVTTDASGVATLLPAANTLTGGRYRVQVINDDPSTYSEAQITEGHIEPEFAPAVSFIDVAGGVSADISVGYVDYGRFGVQGATIYSAVQPDDLWDSDDEAFEVYSIPYALDADATGLTTNGTLGSTYGVAVNSDRDKLLDGTTEMYLGAYAKRGSLYGPGGQGAIYRVPVNSPGDWVLYATVDDAGSTAHVLPDTVEQDYAFRTVVGRESLGDVEITDDNRFLTAVNMNTDSLVVFPVQDTPDPAPVQTLAVPAPASCASDWAPMALAERGANLYVGAVCGADLEAYVIEYLRAADGTLTATGNVRQGNVGLTPGRDVSGPILGGHLDCFPVTWRVWTDTVPQTCVDAGSATADVGAWGPQFVVPQPMFGDIEFLDDGSMALSFRDRSGDQYGWSIKYGTHTNGSNRYGLLVGTGDVVPLSATGIDLDFANPLYDLDDTGFGHNEGAYSGITSVPGSGTLVSNHMDPTNAILTNGLRSFYADSALPNAGNQAAARITTAHFGKGIGLADLESLVLEATQQIGNRVWIDTDEDGVQDPTEPSIAGVQVSLWSADGTTLIATTVTDANGEYYFDTADGILPDTDYQVRLDREGDYLPGGPLAPYHPTDDDNGDDDLDSDGTDNVVGLPAYVVAADITTPEYGINDHSIDFGFVPELVSIGDYVWIDADRDGVQDVGELPVPGAIVRLLDDEGNELATTTTDANGYYVFTDLLANTDYIVEFPTTVDVGAQTYVLTGPDLGGDDALDSDADPTTGRVSVTTPASGENSAEPGEADNPTIDAGFVPVVSIGDYVWIDTDRDGTQDAGEDPVPGATVRLLDADGDEVATTTTDANGYYAFTGLVPGADYTVVFPTSVDAGGTTLLLTEPNQGGDATDSDADPATGRVDVTAPLTGGNSAEPGEADNPTIDAGFIQPSVSVGDFVWVDTDRDGVQDAGEPGIPGVVLRLTGANGQPVVDVFGNPVGPVTTDANGRYNFPNLPAGTRYTVTIDQNASRTALAPYVPTVTGRGNTTNDSSTGSATSAVLPNDGDRDPTLDFGFVRPSASVGDLVWVDTNGNGVQDPGEPGIPGVVINIRDAAGDPVVDVFGNPVGPVTTDSSGQYNFPNLPAGTRYTVTIDQEASAGALAPYVPTTPGVGNPASDSSTGTATSAILPNNGDRDGTLDFGFVPVATPQPPATTPPTTQPVGELPETGGNVWQTLQLTGLLLAAGIGLIAYARRRRTA